MITIKVEREDIENLQELASALSIAEAPTGDVSTGELLRAVLSFSTFTLPDGKEADQDLKAEVPLVDLAPKRMRILCEDLRKLAERPAAYYLAQDRQRRLVLSNGGHVAGESETDLLALADRTRAQFGGKPSGSGDGLGAAVDRYNAHAGGVAPGESAAELDELEKRTRAQMGRKA